MRCISRRPALLLTALTALPLVVAAQQPIQTVRGSVCDPAGTPLEGADEVNLVEFGRDICADATKTIMSLVPQAWCSARGRGAPRSIMGGGGRIRAQSAGGSYVVIWEKR